MRHRLILSWRLTITSQPMRLQAQSQSYCLMPPHLYRRFIIKDRTGTDSTNNVSVTTVGGTVTIDGQTTYTMAGNFDSIELLMEWHVL